MKIDPPLRIGLSRDIPDMSNTPFGRLHAFMRDASVMDTPLLAMGAALGFVAGVGGRAATDEQGKASNLYVLNVAPSSSGKDQAFTGVNLLTRALGDDADQHIAPSSASFQARMRRLARLRVSSTTSANLVRKLRTCRCATRARMRVASSARCSTSTTPPTIAASSTATRSATLRQWPSQA